MTQERTFYSDEKGVRITGTRAIFGHITYSMANISSVSTVEEPPKRAGGIWTAVIGIVVFIVGAIAGWIWLIIGGIVVLAIGVLGALLASGKYHVRISSASGETSALSTKDKNHCYKVAQALNEAIIHRG